MFLDILKSNSIHTQYTQWKNKDKVLMVMYAVADALMSLINQHKFIWSVLDHSSIVNLPLT
jgi:hypothetical protein